MKSLYWHFVRRDCLDNLIGWIFIGILTLVGAPLFFTSETVPTYYFIIFGSLFYFFSMFQQMTVWGGGVTFTDMCLSRHYLQSLPIPRQRMFRISFLRSLFPIIPLLLFLLALPWLGQWLETPRPIFEILRQPFFYIVFAILVTVELMFAQILICRQCLLHEALRKTIGRSRRCFLNLKYALIDVVLGFGLGLMPIGYLLMTDRAQDFLFVVLFAAIGLPFHLWQLYRSYREWMFE